MIALLTIFSLLFTFPIPNYTLEMEITNIDSEGTVYLGLYNSPINFLETEGMYRNLVQKVDPGNATLQINNLPKGVYAISFFIDTNGNGEIDYNFLGMPKEQYGFYVDPGIIFSEPPFEDISFELNSDLKISMKAK